MAHRADICFVYRQESDYPPMGILSLMAYLGGRGIDCRLVYYRSMDQVLRDVSAAAPLMVGYSLTTGLEDFYLDVNRAVRGCLDAVSIFGGPHPTFCPEFIEREGVDVISRGESEEALYEALTLYRGTGELRALAEVPNLHVKLPEGIRRNPVRPLVEDLDSLPPLDRGLTPEGPTPRKAYMLTGRGCPYLCSYCHNHSLLAMYRGKGRYVRKHSVGRVLDQLRVLRQAGRTRLVRFIDDTFVIDADWFREFSDRYPRECGIPYTCNVRANLVDEELVRRLAQSGCVHVSLAAECGDDVLRSRLLNRNVTNAQLLETSSLLRAHAVPFTLLNILALPDTTLDDDLATLRLNQLCRPTIARAFLFQPYPGTRLGDYAISRGLVGAGSRFSVWGHSDSVLALPDIGQRKALQALFGILVAAGTRPEAARRLIGKESLLPWYRTAAKLHYGSRLVGRTHLLNLGDLGSVRFWRSILNK